MYSLNISDIIMIVLFGITLGMACLLLTVYRGTSIYESAVAEALELLEGPSSFEDGFDAGYEACLQKMKEFAPKALEALRASQEDADAT